MWISRDRYNDLLEAANFAGSLSMIAGQLESIQGRLNDMPTQADLDLAISNLETVFQKFGTDVKAAVADLEAKLAAAIAAGTPPDLTAEIARLNTLAANASTLDAATVAADPGAAPPAPAAPKAP